MIASEIYDYIDSFAPFASAAQWDNSGFLAGDKNREAAKVLVCLDVTDKELLQAEKAGASLIVSHHPLIFHPVKALFAGQPAYEAVRRGISVICAHTNFDKALGGVNDTLCEVLEMNFTKLPDSVGEGFLNVGTLPFEGEAQSVAEFIGKKLGGKVSCCDSGETVKKIGICSGAGADLCAEAKANGCNAFITGDASYHDFLDAQALGVSLFAAGHFETEIPAVFKLKQMLELRFPQTVFIQSARENPILTL